MKFLVSFLLSIFCFIIGFIMEKGWQTILLWVAAVILWCIAGILAEKLVWQMEDHEMRLNKLEKRVDKLEDKNKK